LFPTKWNHRLWQIKTALARFQTTRAMTVSQSSADDLENILHIPRERIHVVTEAADPAFRVIDAGGQPQGLMGAWNLFRRSSPCQPSGGINFALPSGLRGDPRAEWVRGVKVALQVLGLDYFDHRDRSVWFLPRVSGGED
jgi:hypothetical protein